MSLIPAFLRNWGQGRRLHNDSDGQLPHTRMSIGGAFGEPAASQTEISVPFVDPNRIDGLAGYETLGLLRDLFPGTVVSTGTGAPVGAETFATLVSRTVGVDDPPLWVTIPGVKLMIAGGGGLTTVAATIPVSAVGTTRLMHVRLLADGGVVDSQDITPPSGAGGATATITVAATNMLLTPGLLHAFEAQWTADSEAVALYSAGATITVTAASVGGGGGGGSILVTIDGDAIVAGPGVIVVGVS
jgi:hypothetical protein